MAGRATESGVRRGGGPGRQRAGTAAVPGGAEPGAGPSAEADGAAKHGAAARDPAAALPLPDRARLRAALPAHCLEPDPVRAGASLLRDALAVAALLALGLRVDSTWLWLALAPLLGTLFWALFVLGHDCGHGSFARRRRTNDAIGLVLHALLLVPYHAWRISHRRHHRFAGHAECDEGWHPITDSAHAALPTATRFVRYRLPWLAFPLYLWRGAPGRPGSHADPHSPLFRPEERPAVRRSLWACAAVLAGLFVWGWLAGPRTVLLAYGLPYLFFAAWVSVVTWLHHAGPGVPVYRAPAWTPLRGALTAVDRHYGPFEWIHHDAGCHTLHHLFPGIPHHRLREARRALAPRLGAALRSDPTPPLRAFVETQRHCQVIPDRGEVVFQRPAPPRVPSGPSRPRLRCGEG